MTRRTKISLSVVGALALAVVLAAVLFDWNMVKPFAERHLSDSSGRPVSLAGDLRVRVSWKPRIHIDNVRIANPPWAREKQMLEADAIDVTLDLKRIWAGDYYLPEVVLTRPKLALEVSPDGRKNWFLDREQKDEKSALHVGRLVVDAGQVVFHDPADKTEVHASVSTGNAPNGQANVVFAATGTLRGQPLKTEGSGGSVMSLRDDSAPYPVKFHATWGKTEADVDGTVTGLVALTVVDMQLGLKGQNFADLYPLLKVVLPPTPPYRITGHLRRQGDRIDYRQFTGRMGSSDLAGDISVEVPGKKRPAVTADLHSKRLDLADLGPLIGAHPKEPKAAKNADRLLPDEPFNVERWDTLDMDVRFKATQLLHAAEMPLDNLAAHVVLKDAVLTLDPLNFGAVGGNFTSKITLDGRSDPLQAKVNASVRKLQLSRVAPNVKLPNTTVGDISGDVQLAGRGNSVARLLANADGKVGFAITDGEVSKLVLKLVGLDIGGYLWTKMTGDRDVPIRCAVASFDANDGILDSKALVFDTADTNVLGEGRVNLSTENLDFTIRPQPKKRSILSLRTPLYVRGTFKHPSVGVNKTTLLARGAAAVGLAAATPVAALVPLVETGPGRDSNCGELVASVEQERQEAKRNMASASNKPAPPDNRKPEPNRSAQPSGNAGPNRSAERARTIAADKL